MKSLRGFLFWALCGWALPASVYGQLNVNSNVTANQLIQSLVGNGLTVSNVQINCSQGGYGTFSNGNTTNLGLDNGVVMSTGMVDSIPGVNPTSSVDPSTCFSGNSCSDPDLTILDPNTSHFDCCVLEFDIVPSCDSLSLRFVFASEEYPEWINSFNDLFGFFITGPNPSGPPYNGTNMAVLPSGQYVSINNVNNGPTNSGPCVNCQYYVDNTNGQYIRFDGMTTVLTSSVGLVPCQTYHFKIAIADAGDCAYDSGVFVDFMECSTAVNFTSSFVDDQCNSCNGSAVVTPSGGDPPYSYTWLPTGGTDSLATGLCAGTYTVLISDSPQCATPPPPDTAFITIGNNGALTATTQQTDVTCAGGCNGVAIVTPNSGSPPFTYTWTPNVSTSDTASGLCAGTYSVTVSSQAGCSADYSFTITEPPQLALSLSETADSVCTGDSSAITATTSGGSPPYTITWSNGLPNGSTQTVSPATTTTYTATLTDANGCSITQPITVAVNPLPVSSFTPGQGGCVPSDVLFTNTSTGATAYQWNFGDPSSPGNTSAQQNPTHTYNDAGTYNVTLITTNQYGCSDTTTLANAVTTYAFPTALFGVNADSVSELSPDIIFTDMSTGGDSCTMYFGDGDSLTGCDFGSIDHLYSQPGHYQAMMIVTNAAGCTDTFLLEVIVGAETSIYLPNAFTPNGSPPNDIFMAYGINVTDFDMMIFDRWGNMIYETKDINKGWDGTLNGHPCQQDVYVWRIKYSDTHKHNSVIYGHVSLIR